MELHKLFATTFLMSSFVASTTHAFPFSYLNMESSISADSITTGDSISLEFIVENEEKPVSYSAAEVATNTTVTIDFPPGTTNLASQDCTQTDANTLECALPELSAGSVANLSASATINSEGYREVIATLNADNLFAGAQVDKKRITVVAPSPNLSLIDLEYELTASNAETEVSNSTYITATVRNLHETNTANFPEIELLVEESLGINTRDDGCNYSGNTVTCEMIALPPLSESKITFELYGEFEDPEVTITGSVSSTQPDAQQQNNEAQLVTSVIPFQATVLCGASNPMCTGGPTDNTSDTDNSNNEQANSAEINEGTAPEPANASDGSSDSGGGSVSPILYAFILLLLSLSTADLVRKVVCRKVAKL